jgi:hypothetical protein
MGIRNRKNVFMTNNRLNDSPKYIISVAQKQRWGKVAKIC